jgi:flavorubredoxin
MITYCEEDKVLFPCDIFSTHVANYEYFNDLAKEDITEDFTVYYSLIMHPHRRYVQEMIEKIKDLDIRIIAPSHGFILREDVEKYIEIYNNMSKNTENDKSAVIMYSTMSGNTKKVAAMLQDYLEKSNIAVEVINVNKTSKEDAIKSIERADALFIGSSTRYADMIGNLEAVLEELENMNLENKLGAAFGSYGWSGEAIEVVQDYLNKTNMRILNTSEIIKSTGMTDVQFPIRVRFSPQEDDVKNIGRAAVYTAELLLNK